MTGIETQEAARTSGYLRHIDGLRGVSVLLVVLYHAWPGSLPGGFIGVDVFFVISGFLITRLLLAEQAAGRFSYVGFLLRRVRRLWPSFALVLAVSLGLGWILLEPEALADLGRSALAAMGFGSNWYFALTTDYFNEGLARNFVLHSWSLAVEEQFYLIYPVVLLWLARSGKALLFGLALIWLISFGAVLALPGTPSGFFVTHLRVWELASGALLWAAMARGVGTQIRPEFGRWIGAFGLAALVAVAFLMPREVWWPGTLTLVPVAGAVLCIAFPWRGLEARWLVGLGLVSYALYLWHWPLLQVLGLLSPGAPDGIIAAVIFLAVGVSWLAWRYVEEPVRRKRVLVGRGALLGVFGGVSVLLGVISLQLHLQNGYPGRFPADLAKIAETGPDFREGIMDCEVGFGPLAKMFDLDEVSSEAVKNLNVCLFGDRSTRPSIVYVGDSHLGAIQREMAERSGTAGSAGAFISLAACPPVEGMDWQKSGPEIARQCKIVQNFLMDLLATGQIERTVLVAHWDTYAGANSETANGFSEHFSRFVDGVSDETELHILLDVPTHDFDVPQALLRWKKWPWLGPPNWLSREQHERVRAPYFEQMRTAHEARGVILHDPVPAFCPENTCLAEIDAGPLYYDESHVNEIGAGFLLDALPDLPR